MRFIDLCSGTDSWGRQLPCCQNHHRRFARNRTEATILGRIGYDHESGLNSLLSVLFIEQYCRIGLSFVITIGAESHYISPRAQNTFSTLVLDQDLSTGLLYQDIRRGARNQWWFINDIGDKKWTIQNVRSGHCLSTRGYKTKRLITQFTIITYVYDVIHFT